MPRTKGSFLQNCRQPARDPVEVGLGFLAEKFQAGVRDLELLSLDPSLHIAPKGGCPLRA
jgi:hypothetical protein